MGDYTLAFVIGLMAGSIFFIDGWGPSDPKEDFIKSRRFRGLSILIAGGVITPVLDYVTQNQRPDFFLSYLKGSVMGWFVVLLFGLIIYIFWKITKEKDKEKFWYKAGEFAYSILDFIYLGIADNPHLKAKRENDVKLAEEIYRLESDHEVSQKKKELEDLDKLGQELDKQSVTPNEMDEATRMKIQEYEKQLKSIKTEADYTFDDWYYKGLSEYDKKEYEKTIAYMKNALEKNQKASLAPDAYLYMGIAYDYLGLFKKGVEQYDVINNNYKDYSYMHLVYTNKGADLIDLNLYDEAVQLLEQATKLNPEQKESWNNLGIGFMRLKRFDESIVALDKAISIDSDYASSWYNKAAVYVLKNDKDEMLKCLKRAIDLNEGYKSSAREDEEFKIFSEDEEFKKLVN